MTHPGVIVKEWVRKTGVSQQEFANRIHISRVRLNELVNGRRGITIDTALRLERVLGVPANHWLELQAKYDLTQIRQKAIYRKIKPLKLSIE